MSNLLKSILVDKDESNDLGLADISHHLVDDKKHEGSCSYSIRLDLLIELSTVQLFYLPPEKAGHMDDFSLKSQLAWVEAKAKMMS